VVDTHVRVLLPRGADGLYGDVVEPAVVVPAGGVVLRRVPVPAHPLLEALDRPEEAAGGIQISHLLQDVALGPDELVRLGEVRRAAVAHDLPRHPSDQRVRRDPREGVRPPAL
jgi:hypothetical protein